MPNFNQIKSQFIAQEFISDPPLQAAVFVACPPTNSIRFPFRARLEWVAWCMIRVRGNIFECRWCDTVLFNGLRKRWVEQRQPICGTRLMIKRQGRLNRKWQISLLIIFCPHTRLHIMGLFYPSPDDTHYVNCRLKEKQSCSLTLLGRSGTRTAS